MLCVHECGLVYVVMSVLLSSVWCVCLPGVLVFFERWRQSLYYLRSRGRSCIQILYSLKGGGRGVRVFF